MQTARQRITPKRRTTKTTSKPKAAPVPKVEVEVPVTVETAEFAAAVNAMAQQFNHALAEIAKAMTAHGARLTGVAEQQTKLLKAIADIKPVVQMPPRPREFAVEIDDDDGGTRQMRVSAVDRLN